MATLKKRKKYYGIVGVERQKQSLRTIYFDYFLLAYVYLLSLLRNLCGACVALLIMKRRHSFKILKKITLRLEMIVVVVSIIVYQRDESRYV